MQAISTFVRLPIESERIIAILTAAFFIPFALATLIQLEFSQPLAFLPLLGLPAVLAVAPLPLKRTLFARALTIGLLTVMVIGASAAVLLVERGRLGDGKTIHDGAVQTEDAIALLVRGQNPYSADYRLERSGRFLESFTGGERPNPMWDHYVYLPVQILASAPISVILRAATGWYDQRVVHFFAAAVATLLLIRMAQGKEWKLLIAVLFLWNPLSTFPLIFGFNDPLVFAFLLSCFWCVRKRHWGSAGIWYGLAIATKQSAWPLAPFLLAYLVWTARREGRRWQGTILVAAATAAAIILPFVFWDARSFFDDVYGYAAGSSSTSYPIAGIGLSGFLIKLGVLKNMWGPYPALMLQIAVGIPTLTALLIALRRHTTLPRTIFLGALFTFAIWYVARYFHSSHLAFISFFVIAALAIAGPPRWLREPSYGNEHHSPHPQRA